MRGTIAPSTPLALCDRAQEEFDSFCEMLVVPTGQLYGGKICAALDRQHPRDLFDVKYLLENEGFTRDIKTGFLFALLSSDRPMHELLDPTMLDQRSVFENHFEGMTLEEFAYDEFELARENLIRTIHANLTDGDREFIISVKQLTPRWDIYDFKDFPSVKWKLQNIQKLSEVNRAKYLERLTKLAEALGKSPE